MRYRGVEHMEEQVRLATFQWLKEQTDIYGEVLPRTLLEKGFDFAGQRVTHVGPAGIWKPLCAACWRSVLHRGGRRQVLPDAS